MTDPQIHPTAIVEDGAVIGPGCKIGPYCIVGPNVRLGEEVELRAHVVLDGHTVIGNNTRIFPFASIGLPPQDLKYAGEPTKLSIGPRNVIREYVTINPGTEHGGGETVIGNDNLIMIGAHIAHDCQIGSHIVMANNATLAGHVVVGDYVWFGGLSAVHQFVRIGTHAVIGGMAGVENDVIPYGRVKGERAHLAGLNIIGLERRGFSKERIKVLQRAFNQIFGAEGTLDQRIENAARDFNDEQAVQDIVAFARAKTKFPLCQPQKTA